MKIWTIGAAGVMLSGAVMPVVADTYTESASISTFTDAVDTKAGARCSSDGKKLYFCSCGTNINPNPGGNLPICTTNGTITSGCKVQGTVSGRNNMHVYCLPTKGVLTPCTVCGCSSGTAYSAWSGTSGNRQYRYSVKVKNEGLFQCLIDTEEKQFGCSPAYYEANGHSESAACSHCPNGNNSSFDGHINSAVGNTAITGCYVLPGTYKDSAGTFLLEADCYYRK